MAGHHDSAAGAAGTMPHDSAGMGQSMMGGDMMQQMDQMNTMMVGMLGASDSAYDQRFIDQMVPHHQGAIMMAEDAVQKAVHPELKEFARKVIDEQRKEIAEMKNWRQKWYGDSAIAMMSGEMPMSMDEMNGKMVEHLGAADSSYDDRFIDMMIPHHRGAVMMAQDAVGKATKPEIKSMAQKIIEDQNKEIAQLETWRRQWYAH